MNGSRTLPDRVELGVGDPLHLGSHPVNGGVNFSIFSRHATMMRLCLYRAPEDDRPALELALDPKRHRTGDIWHCGVPGLGAGALYLWRAEGPFRPLEGMRFNPARALLDPYAKALAGHPGQDLDAAISHDRNSPDADLTLSGVRNDGAMPKCVVVSDEFDWQGDSPLNYKLRECVIYETHVRGFTRGAASGVGHPGTYRGVVEKIPYLQELGVTSLELLPVQEFDNRERFRHNPRTGEPLSNYWGYSTLAFFAPKASFAFPDGAAQPDEGDPAPQVTEFKRMVRELHRAGIEVILDVVFNHTAEGNQVGPTLSLRGLDNAVYYMLDADRRYYKNFSGCGNTLNCNHPVTRSLIMDCLRYWVVEMHVDGFRFDLGSILGRDSKGNLLENPPVIEMIAEDPILRDTKIIAEAWDAGGAYQVGAFPGGRWAEWNDRFRDDVRRFWRGEAGSAVHLATRITGSSDLYLRDGRKPFHSINFVTAHDGFTLRDLVSYAGKHNLDNGEDDRDGAAENWSENFGVEGPTNDAVVREARLRQMKNHLATLLLSIGTPMLLGGDEFGRTQGGNNNAYCQDNPVSWNDWTLLGDGYADLHRFASAMIAFRRRHLAFRRAEFFTGEDSDNDEMPDITWFDEHGKAPDWTVLDLRIAARLEGSRVELAAERDDADFYLMFNASREPAVFILPPAPRGMPWRLALDTSLPAPKDLPTPESRVQLAFQASYALAPRSMVLLMAPR